MSSLIFWTNPGNAIVVTDTLAIGNDHAPSLFCSKAHYVPHLRTIIAGTGAGSFADEWYIRANSRMLVDGLEELNEYTPKALREMWADAGDRDLIPEGLTTTIYMVGFSERSGEMVSFAYRSENNFDSERLGVPGQNLWAVKPEAQVPEGQDIWALFKPMMMEQRANQVDLPLNERIEIGGDAIAMHLSEEGCRTFKLFSFPDREEQLEQARERYRDEQKEGWFRFLHSLGASPS